MGNLPEEDLFSVPWGHHRLIIDRCKGDSSKATFFIRKTIENNWSRAVLDNVIKLLMEFGRGFAFVGKEYPLPIEGVTERIDLMFYNLWIHCYVVVEVKVKPFESRDIGQTATYVAIADDLIRREGDNKTIGLIICKSKNNVLAKYAVGTSKEPIGISEYELSHFLPSPKEIEQKLSEQDDINQEGRKT